MEVEKADYLQEVVGDDDIRVSNMEFLRQKAMGFGNATPGEQGHERAQGGGGGGRRAARRLPAAALGPAFKTQNRRPSMARTPWRRDASSLERRRSPTRGCRQCKRKQQLQRNTHAHRRRRHLSLRKTRL